MFRKINLLWTSVIVSWAMLNAPVAAADPGPSLCAGSTGAAYGLCIAASHLGCGNEAETNPQACGRIEDNYLKITGTMPPWLVTCPCWSPDLIQDQGEIIQCAIQTPIIPDGGAFAWDGGFGCTGTACMQVNVLSCGVGPIGIDIIIVNQITEEENEACLAQIVAACTDAGL